MIKRPLSERFAQAVLAGVKTTTIRLNPWPVGKPIMLYRWTGKPYRSPQADVAVVVVKEVREIRIEHKPSGSMVYSYGKWLGRSLYETEGFGSKAELDSWFARVVRRGDTQTQWLMIFEVQP